MYTYILKNSKTRVFTLFLALASIISLGIFVQSCNKEDEPLDEAILNSPELLTLVILMEPAYLAPTHQVPIMLYQG
jgi:hypothetical protein